MYKSSTYKSISRLLVLTASSLCQGAEDDAEKFFRKYPSPPYQDIVIKNKVLKRGTNQCPLRFDLIKPVLDLYKRHFSVLDIGAAQGYFSFRTATTYPHAKCIMIEDNTPFYSNHGDILYDLCHLNNLNNITYLRKRVTFSDLRCLNKNEHFDVIFAFLVIHQISENLEQQTKIVEELLQLGDNVIIEVANDVAYLLTEFVRTLSTKYDCTLLGEVERFVTKSTSLGKLYWFRTKPLTTINVQTNNSATGIKPETFKKLNGVYP